MLIGWVTPSVEVHISLLLNRNWVITRGVLSARDCFVPSASCHSNCSGWSCYQMWRVITVSPLLTGVIRVIGRTNGMIIQVVGNCFINAEGNWEDWNVQSEHKLIIHIQEYFKTSFHSMWSSGTKIMEIFTHSLMKLGVEKDTRMQSLG